jgi:hypothetical protein
MENTACVWHGACECWGGGSRCGSTGREVLVLVFLCVWRTIEKSFRERVAYWWVMGGGQVLGGWRMVRNGEVLSGCCWSVGGTGLFMTGMGAGVVGVGAGGLPLRHQFSSGGDLEDVKARVCQRMLSSSRKVSVCKTVQWPSVRSLKVQPIRSAPVSELGQ